MHAGSARPSSGLPGSSASRPQGAAQVPAGRGTEAVVVVAAAAAVVAEEEEEEEEEAGAEEEEEEEEEAGRC